MAFNPRQLMRMARWAHRPPSEKRVKLVLAVIVLALGIWGLEKLFGTPDWMRIEGVEPGRIGR